MTRIEIEVFEAHRRLLAETAPDVPSALLARLEKERLRAVNRLPALVDLILRSCSGCGPSDTAREDRGEQKKDGKRQSPKVISAGWTQSNPQPPTWTLAVFNRGSIPPL